MIYITGDCHGDYRRFSKDIFPEQKEMNKDDFMITVIGYRPKNRTIGLNGCPTNRLQHCS